MHSPVEARSCSSFEEELDRVDQPRERFLLGKIREFLEKIKPGDKVLVAYHPDADGNIAGALLKVFIDRYFKGQVRTESCTATLEAQEFYEKAKTCDHVITGDLWIDPKEEKQKGLRALLEQGINIMVFDHHDKDLLDINPSSTDEMLMDGLNYSPLIPETLPQNMNPRTRGKIVCVFPKRLGFTNPDSNKFTAGLVVYKMLSQLADLRDLEFLLPISAKGDGDAGKKFWPKLVEKYGEHDNVIKEIATALNLGKNLTDDAAKRLIDRLISAGTIQNQFETIKDSAELEDLKKLRGYIRGKLGHILEHVTPIDQRFLYYHVTAQDEQTAREGVNGDLKERLELDVGISEAICEEMGRRYTIIVTQMNRAEPRTLHACFKDDRDDTEHDMSELAKTFGGGGHANAAGATIPVHRGWREESVVAEFVSRLKKMAASY